MRREADCPECSLPVERSIHGDELAFCHPAWVKRLETGARVTFIGLLVSIVGGFPLLILVSMLSGGGIGFGSMMALWAIGQAAMSAVVVVGVWMLTAPDPGHLGDERALSARRLARWCILAQLLAAPLHLPVWFGGPGAFSSFGRAPMSLTLAFLQLGMQLLAVVALVGQLAALLYLGRLADRIPRPGLRRQTRVVAWGYGICVVLSIIQAIGMALIMPALMSAAAVPTPTPTPPPPPPPPGAAAPAGPVVFTSSAPLPGYLMASMAILMPMACAAFLGKLAFGIWALVLLGVCAAAFRGIAAAGPRREP